jgi:hypothetical protein
LRLKIAVGLLRLTTDCLPVCEYGLRLRVRLAAGMHWKPDGAMPVEMPGDQDVKPAAATDTSDGNSIPSVSRPRRRIQNAFTGRFPWESDEFGLIMRIDLTYFLRTACSGNGTRHV